MNTFNFLKVPYPPLKAITATLTPKELFNVALQTDEEVLIRLAKLSSTPHNASLDVTIATEQKTIELGFEDCDKNFSIAFAEVLDPDATFTIITTQGAAQLLRTLRNVRTLFTASISTMTIDLGVVDERTLNGLAEMPSEKFNLVGVAENITNWSLAEALNKVKAAKEFCIESDIGLKVLPAPASFPTKKFLLNFAHGITGDDLLNMAGTAEIVLLNSCLTCEDVYQFIKSWFESTETITVSLKVSRKDQEQWSLEKVFGDIPHSEYQNDRRQKSFVTSRSDKTDVPATVEDMSLASDIVRADGLIASVRITESEMFFGVWHNPHEIQTKIDEFTEQRNQTDAALQRGMRRRAELVARRHVISTQRNMFQEAVRQDLPEPIKAELRRSIAAMEEMMETGNDLLQEFTTALDETTELFFVFRDIVDTLTNFL